MVVPRFRYASPGPNGKGARPGRRVASLREAGGQMPTAPATPSGFDSLGAATQGSGLRPSPQDAAHFWHPSGMRGNRLADDRWYRCAQPPATIRHPFGMRGARCRPLRPPLRGLIRWGRRRRVPARGRHPALYSSRPLRGLVRDDQPEPPVRSHGGGGAKIKMRLASGIPPGCGGIGWRMTGGIAALNHRLRSGIPSGCASNIPTADRVNGQTPRHPSGTLHRGLMERAPVRGDVWHRSGMRGRPGG